MATIPTKDVTLEVVDDTTGAPKTGVVVELKRGASTYTGSEIGSSGFYEFTNVPAGQYDVYVSSVDTGKDTAVGTGELAVEGFETDYLPIGNAGEDGWDLISPTALKAKMSLDQVANYAIPDPASAASGYYLTTNASAYQLTAPPSLAAVTLNVAYNNGSSGVITLDAGKGALIPRAHANSSTAFEVWNTSNAQTYAVYGSGYADQADLGADPSSPASGYGRWYVKNDLPYFISYGGDVYQLNGFTGSGTTNTIPKFASASSLGDSHLKDDGSSLVYDYAAASTASFTLRSQLSTDTGVAAEMLFQGHDDGGNDTTYGRWKAVILDNTDTTEDGSLVAAVPIAGTLTDIFTVDENGVDVVGTARADEFQVESTSGIHRNIDNSFLALSGNSSGSVPAIAIFGGSHATQANETEIRSGGNTQLRVSGSGGELLVSSASVMDWGSSEITAYKNIMPNATDSLDIGSSSERFRELFLAGGLVVSAANVTNSGTLQYSGGAAQFRDSGVWRNLIWDDGSGNVTISGNLTVSGTTITADTETVLVEDNIMVLNNGEPGSGVTAGAAGIRVDRGGFTDYLFVFDEVRDGFAIGQGADETAGTIAALQMVATRQDSPTDGGVAFWDNANSQFKTDSNLFWDDTNDRLGVGTASPSTSFHVSEDNSSTTLTDAEANSILTVENSNGGTGTYAGINFRAGSADCVILCEKSASVNVGDLVFLTDDGTAPQPEEQLRIYSNDNGGGVSISGHVNIRGASDLLIWDNDNSHYSGFQVGSISANLLLTLPTALPTSNGQVLSGTTAGVMSWIDPGAKGRTLSWGERGTLATNQRLKTADGGATGWTSDGSGHVAGKDLTLESGSGLIYGLNTSNTSTVTIKIYKMTANGSANSRFPSDTNEIGTFSISIPNTGGQKYYLSFDVDDLTIENGGTVSKGEYIHAKITNAGSGTLEDITMDLFFKET